MHLLRSARKLAALGLVLGALPATAETTAAAKTGEKSILAAAKVAEAKLGLELCSYGFLQFDKSQPLGTYAYFRDRADKDSIALTHAIFQTGGKSWDLTLKPGGLYGTNCTGTGDAPKPPLQAQRQTTLPINEIDEGRTSTLYVTLYDGQLVYTGEEGRRPDPPSSESWEQLRYSYQGSEDDPGGRHEHGAVLLLPRGSSARKSVPKLATYLVRGERQTKNDADLDVTAELVGDQVELTVTVTDDVDVPLRAAAASDADLLRSDHLELWYQNGPLTKDVVQLAVARLADGQVHARWLHPRKVTEPLPKVSAPAPGKLVLQFPAGALFHEKKFFPGLAYQGAFAAVFSDTDDAKKRQETVVASSTLKWGKPETFGKIVWFANGTRFPPFPEGSRVELATSGASAQK